MNKPFSLFSIAAFIAVLGDQLALIAFPWFILSVSEQAWVMGLGIGIIGIPRALAILIGGVFTDHYNPKKVLIFSRTLSALIICAISILLLFQSLSLFLFIVVAGLFSLSTALGFPASPTLLTYLVKYKKFQSANAILMGMTQIAGLLGPIAAGILLQDAKCTDCNSQSEFSRLFFIVSGCFIISGLTIALLPVKIKPSDKSGVQSNFKDQFLDGFKYVKKSRSLSVLFIYLLIGNFVTQGCVMVGIPLLLKQNESGSPFDHGMMMAFLSSGVLFAFVTSRFTPQISAERFIFVLAILNAIIGGTTLLFFYTPMSYFSYLLLFIMGMLSGICQLSTIRYLQTTVTRAYMGRIMSYLLFCIFGLIPLSASITGLLVSLTSTKSTFTLLALSLLVTSVFFAWRVEKKV